LVDRTYPFPTLPFPKLALGASAPPKQQSPNQNAPGRAAPQAEGGNRPSGVPGPETAVWSNRNRARLAVFTRRKETDTLIKDVSVSFRFPFRPGGLQDRPGFLSELTAFFHPSILHPIINPLERFMKTTVWRGFILFFLLTALSCSLLPSGSSPAPETRQAPAEKSPLPPNTPPEYFKDIPIMPGAFSGNAIGTTYKYQIHATVLEVQEYYLREMPKAGWELENQTGDADQGDTSTRLRFRKGGEMIAIFIDPAGEGLVQVTIL
jgi:hypothetical protein